jgi:hypothetical protein
MFGKQETKIRLRPMFVLFDRENLTRNINPNIGITQIGFKPENVGFDQH